MLTVRSPSEQRRSENNYGHCMLHKNLKRTCRVCVCACVREYRRMTRETPNKVDSNQWTYSPGPPTFHTGVIKDVPCYQDAHLYQSLYIHLVLHARLSCLFGCKWTWGSKWRHLWSPVSHFTHPTSTNLFSSGPHLIPDKTPDHASAIPFICINTEREKNMEGNRWPIFQHPIWILRILTL